MNAKQLCPKCRKTLPADAPEGLCPQCLVQAGLGTQPSAGGTIVLGEDRLPPRELPQPGQQFGGYRIVRELGHGGMGAVYEAEHPESGRRVALKVLSHKLDSPEAHQRFLREGRLAASINHPNSVYIYGTEEIDGTPAIAMELIAGGTLQESVERNGPLAVGEAVNAILQIIAGLEAAQAIGILHRDIKPANCFQDADGTVKVGDFGLSISTAARGDTNLTLHGQFLGTPAFASPEQLRGEELNVRSDMYSVGVTLFYLLTGRTPFEGRDFVQLLANVLEKPAPSPKTYRPALPAGLANVVLRCLEKLPGERFRSYEELRQALAPFGSDAPVPAPLGLRFVAGVVDSLLLGACGTILGLATGQFGFQSFTSIASQLSPGFLTQIAAAFVVMLLYFAIMEGLRGASLGKFLCRLRVAGPDRNPPGVPRALLRALIYLLLPPLPFWIAFGFNPYAVMSQVGGYRGQLIGLLYYVLLALLFCTARRRNGFAAIQDLLTGTRVIRKPACYARPALTPAESVAPVTENRPKVGPYHIIETPAAGSSSQWLLGYDTRLLRKVWIRTAAVGTPPTETHLRSLGRVGRLRWIAGRRSESENWDAFEGVGGEPFLKLLGQSHPWSQVRYWLLDLATEIAAAEKDGTLPAVLAFDRVWITGDGRAKLLDFPAPGVVSDTVGPTFVGEPGQTGAFLHLLAIAALNGQTPPADGKVPPVAHVPLPTSARSFLENLPRSSGIEGTVAALKSLVQQAALVTRWRRAGLVMGCLAFPIMAGLGFSMAGRLWDQWQREQPELIQLSQVLNTRQGMHMAERFGGPKFDDKAFATYIAAQHRGTITNARSWSNFLALVLISEDGRQFAEKALADHPSLTEKEIAEATSRVKPLLPPVNPFTMMTRFWMPPVVLVACLFMYVMVPALVSALAFRGGLLLRLLGLAVVRKDGSRASRLQILWRSVVAWSPVLSAPVVLAVLIPLLSLAKPPSQLGLEAPPSSSLPGGTSSGMVATNVSAATNAPALAPAQPAVQDDLAPSAAAIWAGATYLLLVLGVTLCSLAFPERSLQDRIAGTCLVLR